jgi:GT2 family glycosyltransferase
MPDVAMAGAKLLFDDGTLQHGGHVYSGQPNHVCVGWRGDSPGPWPLRPLAVERECSGVTAACAVVRRSVFEEVGGLPTELPLSYNDVDFSLKLRRAGHRVVWTPWAVWYHFESRTRDSRVLPEEREWLDARWFAELSNDPYYNPNLVPRRHDFLELPSQRRPTAWSSS